jgi:hypothetical protein
MPLIRRKPPKGQAHACRQPEKKGCHGLWSGVKTANAATANVGESAFWTGPGARQAANEWALRSDGFLSRW